MGNQSAALSDTDTILVPIDSNHWPPVTLSDRLPKRFGSGRMTCYCNGSIFSLMLTILLNKLLKWVQFNLNEIAGDEDRIVSVPLDGSECLPPGAAPRGGREGGVACTV